jgi:AbrB family looped-hinge helix DNA binding protein
MGEDMSGNTTVSSEGELLIPKAICERMGWTPGQKLAFIVRVDGILVTPIPERADLAGMARGANPEGYRERGDRT